jgi:hypothetical protein
MALDDILVESGDPGALLELPTESAIIIDQLTEAGTNAGAPCNEIPLVSGGGTAQLVDGGLVA